MSQALASARKRRAPTNPSPVPISANQPSNNNETSQPGLTLPQVISLIDRRLINLETYVNTQQIENEKNVLNNNSEDNTSGQSVYVDYTNDIIKLNDNINEIATEFNTRYDILANEILDIKNMLLKLQSFTMEVNKSLLEERNAILPNVCNTNDNFNQNMETKSFSLEDTTLTDNTTETLDKKDVSFQMTAPSYSFT